MTLLDIKDVRGGYGEVDILNGISLSLQKGEILTVAGTNGAGKSTLAKAIVGLLPRVSGGITFEARDSDLKMGAGRTLELSAELAMVSILCTFLQTKSLAEVEVEAGSVEPEELGL